MNSPKKHPDQYHHGDLKAAILQRSAEIISESGLEALSLRGVARDLGVSHGAPGRHFRSKAELLAALVTDIWHRHQQATLQAADQVDPADPLRRLNAMGRGYLRWALENRTAFQAMSHPDIRRHQDDSVKASQAAFHEVIMQAVIAAQKAGRHQKTDAQVLTVYTTAVPYGAAMLLATSLMPEASADIDQEQLITELIDLVVPLPD